MAVLLNLAALAWAILGIVLSPIQFFVTAPYGRHVRADWGRVMSNQLGWCLMELVSLVVFAGLFLSGPNVKTAPMWIFFALWCAHYVNRSLIFPWRTRTKGKTIPLAIVGSAMGFNIVNAGLNGLYLGWFGDIYPDAWLTDPRFIAGLASTGQEPDELVNVTPAGDSQVQVSLEPGDTQIPARGFLQLADDSAANITVQGEEVVAGGYVRLTLEFAQAEPAEVNVPVVAPGEDFADVASLTPSASTTETPTESPSESPTESE